MTDQEKPNGLDADASRPFAICSAGYCWNYLLSRGKSAVLLPASTVKLSSVRAL